MAWQPGNVSNGVGGMAGAETGGYQAYTLQGVMRFLQTEWHRHERDRNAWDIEREEMKKRIAGLEGEVRSSKGMRGILERQIRMLELALKKERDSMKRLKNGESIDTSQDSKDFAKQELDKLKDSNKVLINKNISQLDAEISSDDHLAQGIRQETERDKSKTYLTKCSSEITYRVLPTTHIPPDPADPAPINSVLAREQPTQRELQDAYIQLQQIKQQQHRDSMAMVRDGPLPPQQQSIPAYSDISSLERTDLEVHGQQISTRDNERKLSDQPGPVAALPDARRLHLDANNIPDDQVESISHSYDGYGRQVPTKDENEIARTIEDTKGDTADWDFDEPPPPITQATESQQLHRPDTEAFPIANINDTKSPPRGPGSYRRKSSGARRRSEGSTDAANSLASMRADAMQFKVRFVMRGHLDVVRTVIFTGGGSPSEPEFCSAGDDGTVKRWHIPTTYTGNVSVGDDLDRMAHFTHRGHLGAVCSLAACPATNFSNGGRVAGDGWIFSGGEDASVKVWERGRVDAKASLEGHTDAVWALCVLPGSSGSILGEQCSQHGGPDRVLLAAGAADGTILIWAVSAPPQLSSPHAGSNRGARSSRRANSISAGSNFPSSPQPSVASNTVFNYSLVHRIERTGSPSPTSISPLSAGGESFVVSYTDASVLVFDTRTGEEIVGMASQDTYDGTPNTAVNAVVARSSGFDAPSMGRRGSMGEEEAVHSATGNDEGFEGVVIAGYEDRYIRLFDANSGQCTYTMLAHPSAISSLSLSPDGRELVSGGHDASLRFWSLEKRNCTQEITYHRIMRGEGVCAVVWSPDGRWVISAGGDGAVKVFSRT